MSTTRRFPRIDQTAFFVVTDEQDLFAPAPFWLQDDARERTSELWETGYRPELWRRIRNLSLFERIP